LCRYDFGAIVDVRGREAQEPESSVDKQILATIILDQSLPMIAAVVLEDELRRGIVEVGPTDEPCLGVTEIRLDLWPRQAGLDQEPAKPSFHRRFGGSRKRGQRTQPACTRPTFRRLGVANQGCSAGETCADGHIDGDQCFDRRALQAKSGEGERQRCCAQPANGYNLSR